MAIKYTPTRFKLPTSKYDKAKADRAVGFMQMLKHTIGEWRGDNFELLPWQEHSSTSPSVSQAITLRSMLYTIALFSTLGVIPAIDRANQISSDATNTLERLLLNMISQHNLVIRKNLNLHVIQARAILFQSTLYILLDLNDINRSFTDKGDLYTTDFIFDFQSNSSLCCYE